MFSRIANLFKGFLSLFVSGLERQNPKALIEAEKENLRAQIARFNENLANHAGLRERLLRQVKNLEAQERDLAAKAAANLKVGNRNAAGQYALQLKTVKEQLEENRKQLEAAETTYKKLVKSRDVSVRDAQDKIEKLKRMMTETEMLEAQAELQEMATGMVTSIGGSGDTLNRVEEYLTERRDKAAGRARVAASTIDTDEGRAAGGGAAGPRRRRAHRVRGRLRPRGAAGREGRRGRRAARRPRRRRWGRRSRVDRAPAETADRRTEKAMEEQPKVGPTALGKMVLFLFVLACIAGAAYYFRDLLAPGGRDSGKQVNLDDFKKVEAPDTKGITTVNEYKYVPGEKLPPVKGVSAYKWDAAAEGRELPDQRLDRLAPDRGRERRLLAEPGLDLREEVRLQGQPQADRRPGGRARRLRRRGEPRALGHPRHDGALRPRPHEGLAQRAAHLPAGRLVLRRRRHRGPRQRSPRSPTSRARRSSTPRTRPRSTSSTTCC